MVTSPVALASRVNSSFSNEATASYYTDRFTEPLIKNAEYDPSKVYYWIDKKSNLKLPENIVLVYKSIKTEVEIYKSKDSFTDLNIKQ